ncbi:MAG: tRNA pseudouridine(38-40) synthase TruA [Gammaproteobacteria bacterium]
MMPGHEHGAEGTDAPSAFFVGARVALVIEYDGSGFHGWQVQPNARTVQAELERALAAVATQPIATICAGRTDTGVHALSQVVHFDVPCARPPNAWTMGLNSNLPDDVRVLSATPVDGDFHARFGAVSRTYRYVVLNRAHPSPLARQRSYWQRQALDIEAMREAAAHLVGEHDFSAFRAASCQAPNPIRTVQAISIDATSPWVTIDITANAFLQNMVRIVVGSLLRVGRGEATPAWMGEVLQAGDRRHRGKTAPPQGLFFAAVRYEARFGVPSDPTSYAPSDQSSIIMAP